VLGWFWWKKVVPAREALRAGVPREVVEARFEPRRRHELAEALIARSRQMGEAATNLLPPPPPPLLP
jgi:enoyl-CoA hydratase/carnithine racemase